MNDLYLIPQDGLNVRDPRDGKPLPAEGAFKPRSQYWLRRLRDKDVSEGQPPRRATAAPASTSKGDAK